MIVIEDVGGLTIRSTDEFQQTDELFKSKLNTWSSFFFPRNHKFTHLFFSRFKKQQFAKHDMKLFKSST